MKFLAKVPKGIEWLGMWFFGLIFRVLRKEMTEQTDKTLRQFIRFCLIGVSNTLISWVAAYAIMLTWRNWQYQEFLAMIANTAGFVISIFNAYYWNQKYVFDKGERSHVVAFLRTLSAYSVGFVLSLIIPFICVKLFHIDALYTPLIVMVFTIPINFLMNKLWAFRKKK